jgi:hypothetical protein
MRTTWAVVALVIAAAVQLVVTLAPQSYALIGPYFQPTLSIVLGALDAIVPFGLAAAVLVGADRWPAGRNRLWWAAAALAVVGAADLVGDLLLNATTSTGELPEAYRVIGPALFLLRSVAMLVAVLLVASGLWGARGSHDHEAEPTARAGGAVPFVALLGVACVVATGWTWVSAVNVPPEFVVTVILDIALLALGFGALAVLAIVALRTRPAEGAAPELLIAIGSVLAMLGATVNWVLPSIFLGDWPEYFVTLTALAKIVELTGFALVAAGFVIGGVGAKRATSAQPA